MHFLNFPPEIRVIIYSELLVQDSPVEFGAGHATHIGRRDLNPALLRVNKKVNREAIPFLYSNNRFQFPDVDVAVNWTLPRSGIPYIAPFLQQIGDNAGLLRHICINFPRSFAPGSVGLGRPVLDEKYTQVLQLIRETCLGLRTVEISCKPEDNIFPLLEIDQAEKMMRTLDDGGLGAMPSLEKIIVVCGEYDMDEDVMASRESLMQRTPSGKWSIELTKIPPQTWISVDDMVEFHNYEDCCRYNDEVYVWEEKRREEREEREWQEELCYRRNDPYWKNDSDYD